MYTAITIGLSIFAIAICRENFYLKRELFSANLKAKVLNEGNNAILRAICESLNIQQVDKIINRTTELLIIARNKDLAQYSTVNPYSVAKKNDVMSREKLASKEQIEKLKECAALPDYPDLF